MTTKNNNSFSWDTGIVTWQCSFQAIHLWMEVIAHRSLSTVLMHKADYTDAEASNCVFNLCSVCV